MIIGKCEDTNNDPLKACGFEMLYQESKSRTSLGSADTQSATVRQFRLRLRERGLKSVSGRLKHDWKLCVATLSIHSILNSFSPLDTSRKSAKIQLSGRHLN